MGAGAGGVKDANGWITIGGIRGSTIAVANSSDLFPGTVAIEVENPNMDEFTTIGIAIGVTEARQLAAALNTLADAIDPPAPIPQVYSGNIIAGVLWDDEAQKALDAAMLEDPTRFEREP